MLPFLTGTLYALWEYQRIDPLNFLLMLISLLCIDMATTASNHYTDFIKAIHKQGYNYEQHNTLARDGLSLKTALGVIVALVGLAVISGVLLVLRTDWVVLAIGAVSFGAGLMYSWGPLPLSRTPLAEAVSGFFMGFVIVFLSIYIHVFHFAWIGLILSGTVMTVQLDLYEVFRIFVISVPLVCGIANIMLSNNLCDMEEDRINGRHTLPILIGRSLGLRLSQGLYAAMFLGLLLGLFQQWIPLSSSLAFLGIPFVYRASVIFTREQSKKETFVLSVKSFLLVSALYCLGIGIGVLLG